MARDLKAKISLAIHFGTFVGSQSEVCFQTLDNNKISVLNVYHRHNGLFKGSGRLVLVAKRPLPMLILNRAKEEGSGTYVINRMDL